MPQNKAQYQEGLSFSDFIQGLGMETGLIYILIIGFDRAVTSRVVP